MLFRLALAALLLLPASPALAADPLRPDPVLTPGDWNDPPTPLPVLCAPGYTATVRHVPQSLKTAVFRSYGFDPATVRRGDYEVDHLVSLELDGRNTLRNLWPQSYRTAPLNATRKDVLENQLKRLVCTGKLPLAAAQKAIATDWVAAYATYVQGAPAAPHHENR